MYKTNERLYYLRENLMPENKADSRGAPGEGPASKQAVYNAAVRLFARKGFAATGMRELSREAGVNLATVNYFYGSKKGLLKVIIEDYFQDILAVLTENLAGDDAPDVKLRRNIAAVARYFSTHTDKMIIALTELPHDDPDITEFKAERFRRISGLLQSSLGDTAAHIPVSVIGPAMVGLAASRFLFLPVLQKVLPPGSRALGGVDYPEMIAELFVNGINGLLAAGPGGKNGGGND